MYDNENVKVQSCNMEQTHDKNVDISIHKNLNDILVVLQKTTNTCHVEGNYISNMLYKIIMIEKSNFCKKNL